MQALYSFTKEKTANASPPCRRKQPVTAGVMSALFLLLSGNLALAAQDLAVEEFAAIRESGRLMQTAPADPPAAAELAAPVPATVTFDDPRDGIQCPGATLVADLSLWFRDHPVQSGQTIVLCSGEYLGPLDIHGVANVQVLGKKDYKLGPPRIVPALATQGPETFRLIQILDSSKVTISGLVLDGIVRNPANGVPGEIAWPLDPFHPISGIYVNNASVTIKNNWIMHMKGRSDRNVTGAGIRVEGNSAAAQPIRVQNNSLLDFVEAAIQIGGLHTRYVPIVTGNVIATPGTVGIRLMWVQAGTVSGNVIGPDPDVRIVTGENCGRCGTGISLEETRHVNVTANVISNMGGGVLAGSIHQEFPFSDNTISGNTIRDTTDGIRFLVSAASTGQAFVTGNKFTGNTLTDSFRLPATRAITVVNAGVPGGVGLSNNMISGNTIIGYGVTKSVISSNDTNPAHVAITNNKIVGFKAGVLP